MPEEVVRPGFTDRNLQDPYDPDNAEGPVDGLTAPPGHDQQMAKNTVPADKKPATEQKPGAPVPATAVKK